MKSAKGLLRAGLPAIGVGTFQIKDESILVETLRTCLKAGYIHIDTASVYKNEAFIGKHLKELLDEVGLTRADVFITSKLSPSDQGYDSAKASIHQSLDRLQCGYLDLYLIHWPGKSKLKTDDPKNREYRMASWKALEEAQQENLVKRIGVSNYTIAHLEDMACYANVLPAVNQVEFHPHLYQKELLDYCQRNGIQIQAYSSLGTGELVNDPSINELASKYGKSSAQILLRWGIQHGVGVIPKSTKKDHILNNIDIFTFEITPEDMERLDNMNKSKHYCWDPSFVI